MLCDSGMMVRETDGSWQLYIRRSPREKCSVQETEGRLPLDHDREHRGAGDFDPATRD